MFLDQRYKETVLSYCGGLVDESFKTFFYCCRKSKMYNAEQAYKKQHIPTFNFFVLCVAIFSHVSKINF